MFQYNEFVGVRVGHVDQLHVSPLAVSCCDVCFERDPSFVLQKFMLYSLFIFISLTKLVSNTIYISNYVRVVVFFLGGGVRVGQSLIFNVAFCRWAIVYMLFFFLFPLYSMSFSDLRLLISILGLIFSSNNLG